MKVAVVGGAGFIGSHVVDALVARGDQVVVVDDLSNGKRAFIEAHLASGAATLSELCVSHEPADVARLVDVLAGVERVFQLVCNPDARRSLADTFLDLRQNALTTWAVLEAMRLVSAKEIVLASSGTIYGDVAHAVAEDHGPMLPISLYGASKAAAEAYVSAYAHCFGLRGWIFRFGNVVGSRQTHGIALDLMKKLDADPTKLEVLGNGKQQKPYLHVSECIAGIFHGLALPAAPVAYFNVAPPDTIEVRRIAEIVIEEMGLTGTATIAYTGGARGWVGDVVTSMLSSEKLAKTGFQVQLGSEEAVRRAMREICEARRA